MLSTDEVTAARADRAAGVAVIEQAAERIGKSVRVIGNERVMTVADPDALERDGCTGDGEGLRR